MNPCASSFNPKPPSNGATHCFERHDERPSARGSRTSEKRMPQPAYIRSGSRAISSEAKLGGAADAQHMVQRSNPAIHVLDDEASVEMESSPFLALEFSGQREQWYTYNYSGAMDLTNCITRDRNMAQALSSNVHVPVMPHWILAQQIDAMNRPIHDPALALPHPYCFPRSYGTTTSLAPDAIQLPISRRHDVGSTCSLPPPPPAVPTTMDQHLQTYYFPLSPMHPGRQPQPPHDPTQHVPALPISPASSSIPRGPGRVRSRGTRSRSRHLNGNKRGVKGIDYHSRASSAANSMYNQDSEQAHQQRPPDGESCELEESQRGRSRYRIVSSVKSGAQLGHTTPLGSTASISRRVLSDAHVVRDRSPSGPPSNAPKAPAAFRRHLSEQSSSILTYQKPSTSTVSWSQSKRWVSDGSKERAVYQKLMQSLHYMGADHSPCLPQTPGELTSFRVSQAESKSRVFSEKLRRLEEAEAQKKRFPEQLRLFHGLELLDSLSPVFAAVSCFNKHLDPTQQAEWPGLAEFKEDGDKRAARFGRYFPLPRLNIIAKESEGEDAIRLYNSDGSIN